MHPALAFGLARAHLQQPARDGDHVLRCRRQPAQVAVSRRAARAERAAEAAVPEALLWVLRVARRDTGVLWIAAPRAAAHHAVLGGHELLAAVAGGIGVGHREAA